MSSGEKARGGPPQVPLETIRRQLRYASFAYFMNTLVDARGEPLTVTPFHEVWCQLLSTEPRLALLAPRDHGKSTELRAYVLWQFYRHACDPRTGLPSPHSGDPYSVVVYSATWDQAEEFGVRFRELCAANPAVLDVIDPHVPSTTRLQQTALSRRELRFASGASLVLRSFGTSTRGLHPDLLILDDALSDENSATSQGREKTWNYFAGTLLPMNPAQIVVAGTALHRDDLLHRLGRPTPGSEPLFESRKYRAFNPETGTALWPERHPPAELLRLRDLDPTAFSREFMNDPRDDAASLFPSALTDRAIAAGAELTFASAWKAAGEVVVLGADLAISERARADFTVVIVAAYNITTRCRRVLEAQRHKGLDLRAQEELIADLCVRFDVSVAVVEDNGFQKWLIERLEGRPETRGRVVAHTTGRDKRSAQEGVLRLRRALLADQWLVPSGDAPSRRFARVWQDELAAFGWRDGRPEGVGEHDDVVMASWFVELAVRRVDELLAMIDEGVIVTGEELGIERYRISPDLDDADAAAGVDDWYGTLW